MGGGPNQAQAGPQAQALALWALLGRVQPPQATRFTGGIKLLGRRTEEVGWDSWAASGLQFSAGT